MDFMNHKPCYLSEVPIVALNSRLTYIIIYHEQHVVRTISQCTFSNTEISYFQYIYFVMPDTAGIVPFYAKIVAKDKIISIFERRWEGGTGSGPVSTDEGHRHPAVLG